MLRDRTCMVIDDDGDEGGSDVSKATELKQECCGGRVPVLRIPPSRL
jgi:hypothetical protein